MAVVQVHIEVRSRIVMLHLDVEGLATLTAVAIGAIQLSVSLVSIVGRVKREIELHRVVIALDIPGPVTDQRSARSKQHHEKHDNSSEKRLTHFVTTSAALLRAAEWNATLPDAQIRTAFLGSTAWVGAFRGDELIGTARAVSDGAKYPYIADVLVTDGWRAKGVGDALMTMLLDHPALRRCYRVTLRTRTAAGFHARMGFVTIAMEGERPWMALDRAGERQSFG